MTYRHAGDQPVYAPNSYGGPRPTRSTRRRPRLVGRGGRDRPLRVREARRGRRLRPARDAVPRGDGRRATARRSSTNIVGHASDDVSRRDAAARDRLLDQRRRGPRRARGRGPRPGQRRGRAVAGREGAAGRARQPRLQRPRAGRARRRRRRGSRARRRRARRRLAATAARWPEPQIDGDRPLGVEAVGQPSMSCHGVNTEPGMWPASHSLRSRTSRIWTSSARAGSSSSGSALDRVDVGASPGASWSCRRAGSRPSRADADRHGELRRRARPSSSSRPTNTISCSRSASQASSRAEAGAEHRDRRPRRGCARRRTAGRCARRRAARPRRACCSTWRGASGSSSTPSVSSGPRLSSTIALKFGGCGPEPGQRLLDELVLVLDRQRRVVRALEADRRGDLHVHPRARRTSSRRGGRARPRRAPGSASSLSCSERKIPRAPSDFSIARSGRATSLTNSVSPVSTAHGSSPRPRVDQRERGVLGPVAGRVQRADAQRRRARHSSPSSNGSWS